MEEVKKSIFEKTKLVMDKAGLFTTPLKKRVRDSLDEEEPWNFVGFNSDLSLTEQLAIIETALQENQKEHN